MTLSYASAAGVPVSGPELIIVPGSPRGASRTPASSPVDPSGWITGRISRPYCRANAKSRSSCAGTAMIAPVP